MTSTAAIAIALSLIFNSVTFIYKGSVIQGDNPESKLVFLLCICLLLRKICVIPNFVKRRITFICVLVEISLVLFVLESSLTYVWEPLKDYVLSHSEDVQEYFYEEFDYFFCPLCSGRTNCTEIFACFLLKASTFALLLLICSMLFNKKY